MCAMTSLVYDFVKTHFGESATVLYACEAGSTAKGYAGVNSDHDVRVVVLRDKADYLKLVRPKDCFEQTNLTPTVDMCVYDVTKALGLLVKSNPNVREWLMASNCAYVKAEPYFSYLMSVCDNYLSLYNLACCYQGLATSSFRTFVNANQMLNVKKALHLSHSMMSVRWMVDTHTAPPLTVQELSSNDAQMTSVLETLLTYRNQNVNSFSDSCVLNYLNTYYQQVSEMDFSQLPSSTDKSFDMVECVFAKMLAEK